MHRANVTARKCTRAFSWARGARQMTASSSRLAPHIFPWLIYPQIISKVVLFASPADNERDINNRHGSLLPSTCERDLYTWGTGAHAESRHAPPSRTRKPTRNKPRNPVLHLLSLRLSSRIYFSYDARFRSPLGY